MYMQQQPFSPYDEDPQLNAPMLDPRIARSPLFARLFDRMAHGDPNSVYSMDDDSKKKAFKQGLLQFAAAVSKPNGGNFANALSQGLLSGSNSMNDAQSQYGNDAYRNDVMKRTQAEMLANTQKQQAWQHLYGSDGSVDPTGEKALQQADPQGYADYASKLHPQQKWTPVNVNLGGNAGTLLSDGQGNLRTLDGQPFNGGQQGPQGAPQGAPAPTTGGGPQIMGNALADAVQSVESGGNPNAVSPKGALGSMQTMPNTLRDPGYGVQPARDNSPEEQARVGRDYLAAMTKQYGTQGGLAAYNMGPGAWQASLSKYGSPDAALSHAPAETQAYVPRVLARAGQPMGAPPAAPALPFGFAPKAGAEKKLSTVEQRRQDIADMEANGVPVPKEARNTYLMTGKMPTAQDVEVPGDPNKTGDAYLATIPPEMRPVVKAIASGQQDPPSASSRSPQAQALLQAVYAYDPSANQINLPVRRKVRTDYTSGKSFQNMRALNQVAAHLEQLDSQIGQVAGHKIPLIGSMVNAAENAYAKRSGEPGIINWQSTADAVAHETRSLFAGSGGGTLDELHGYLDTLSANNSDDQKRAALRNIAKLVKSRTAILADGYKQGMGTTADPFAVTFPHSAKALDRLSSDEASKPASAGGLTPAEQAELDQLRAHFGRK